MTEQPQNETPLAIQTWKQLVILLTKESSPYLDKAKFVINTDAYARITDEDIESDTPFLSYDYTEITSDESLDFSILLFKNFVMFVIGPTSVTVAYEALGFNSTDILKKNEEQIKAASPVTIAKNILLTLKLLLNGQIAAGCSWKNGTLCAFETFLLGFEHKPFPLFITQSFSLFTRGGDTYTTKQNKVLKEHFPVTKNFPLLPPIIDGTRLRQGRDVVSVANLEPLTKAQYDAIDTAVTIHSISEQQTAPGKEWKSIYRTVDFWMAVTIFTLATLGLREIPSLAPFFNWDYSSLILIAIAWTIIPAATGWSLGTRQVRVLSGDEPLRYRLEKKIHVFGWRRLICFVSGLILAAAALFLPFWTLTNETSVIHSTLELGAILPVLFLLPLLSLVIPLVVLMKTKPNLTQIIAGSIALTVGVLFIVFNGLYMNTSDQAPMPPDVAITLTVLPITAIISCGVRTLILMRRKPRTTEEAS